MCQQSATRRIVFSSDPYGYRHPAFFFDFLGIQLKNNFVDIAIVAKKFEISKHQLYYTMKYPNPLRPYKAQLMLGLIAALLVMAGSCFGQTYQCEVSTSGNVTYKFSTRVNVTDSTVVFITNGKTNSSKRVKSDQGIYFTDGVVTNLLELYESTGSKKGFQHTHQLVMKSSATPQALSLIHI